MKKNERNRAPGTFGFKFLMFFIRPLFRMWYTPQIINAHNIPDSAAVVIAGNHKHVYDQCLTILATRRPINYLAKSEYFEGRLAPFFRFAGCIPVNRNGRDYNAMKAALCVLRRGGAVGIFPEGTRNKTQEFMLPFKPGAVSLAKKTGAVVVPFGLCGDYRFRSKNLVVRFGEPFSVENMSVEQANERLHRDVERLMRENLGEAAGARKKIV